MEECLSSSAYVTYLEALASRWSSASAASLIDSELLAYLQPRFHRCSTPLKVRVILSFLYLPEKVRQENREALLRVLGEAEVDRDEWVKKLSRLVSSFVAVGSIDVRETDSETAFHLLKFLHVQKEKHKLTYLSKPPLESPYLANVLLEKMMVCEHLLDFEESSLDFLTKARVVADRSHFSPKIDFVAFNAELMVPGEVAMRKALQKNY